MTPDAETLSTTATPQPTDRIRWYVRTRWAGIGGGFAMAAAAGLAGFSYPHAAVLAVLATSAACNASFTLCHRPSRGYLPCPFRQRPTSCMTVQVALDWVVLLLLLHLSGGVENPLFMLLALHACLTGVLLPPRSAVLATLGGGVAFCLMAFGELAGVIPHVTVRGFLETGLYREPMFVGAVCFTVLVTSALGPAVASLVTERLRKRNEQTLRISRQLRKASEEAADAYERLRKLDEEKSRFLYVAAHELGSPLATIDSLLSVISEGYAGHVDEKAAAMIKRARGKIRGLLDLVRDLMTLSRVKEGLQPAKRELVDVKGVLQRILEDEGANAAEKNVTLTADLPRHIPPLLCTRENVDGLFRNLIHNAVKYTPAGGTVSVKVTIDGAAIEAVISDTGIGIPEEDLPKVFTEFYRAPNARRYTSGGTGLGLSIVKRVIDTLGGDIHVESEPGEGTTFRLRVPGYGSGD